MPLGVCPGWGLSDVVSGDSTVVRSGLSVADIRVYLGRTYLHEVCREVLSQGLFVRCIEVSSM